MVCAPHHLAAEAGADILRAGGTAVDAAIAANAVLNVVYPQACGIGGDGFWLIYDAAGRQVEFLNASGRAPQAATIAAFRVRGHAEIPHRGMLPVMVPGCVAGWCGAHERYGRLPFRQLLAPAIGYAANGFPLTARVSAAIAREATALRRFPASARIFLPDGVAPPPGAWLVQKDLARTLDLVAEGGREAFYRGEIAEEILQTSALHGGLLVADDFDAVSADWGEPIRSTYRGIEIVETPPNTQGLVALIALNVVEAYDLRGLGFQSPVGLHLMIEAAKLGLTERDRYVTDPAFADIPLGCLISKAHAASLRARIDPERATPRPAPGGVQGDTVSVCVVDPAGNAVSLIQSIYFIFGSGVVAGETGIVLQNRGAYFSLAPEHVNRLEPGKRTCHTLMASLAFRDGELEAVFGTMGADGQPQTHVQVYSALIDHGLGMAEAIAAPRWLAGRFFVGDPTQPLGLEGRFPASTVEALRDRGHPVQMVEDWSPLMGNANGIVVDRARGVLHGGSDPRSDGAAVGL
jgi:gamma-glutamyltranspeptidase/glutathione hydrolase